MSVELIFDRDEARQLKRPESGRPVFQAGFARDGEHARDLLLGTTAASNAIHGKDAPRKTRKSDETDTWIVGRSPQIRRVCRLVEKVAPSRATVFVTGESGVGKELVARAVHEASHRRGHPMVTVNCSAIPTDLIESELFGHKRGSFTGAARDHRGFFQQAHGGTLLLDEISEMDVSLQAKLLRVLETNRVRPIGGEQGIEVDCRIIATSNRDPAKAVGEGYLRQDLYYRLAQFPIHVPPLRERGDDVLLLAAYFLAEQNAASGSEKTFRDDAVDAIMQHHWPGNVRELRNATVHAHLLADARISAKDLPAGIPSERAERERRSRDGHVVLPLAEIQRRHILAALEACGGNKKRTAESLGVALKTLYNHLHRYGEM